MNWIYILLELALFFFSQFQLSMQAALLTPFNIAANFFATPAAYNFQRSIALNVRSRIFASIIPTKKPNEYFRTNVAEDLFNSSTSLLQNDHHDAIIITQTLSDDVSTGQRLTKPIVLSSE